jgi:hypothetical protein
MSDDRRTITFWLPGRVIDAIRDGNWPNDNPPGWADIHDARYEGRGRGYRKYVRTSRANANDLADYLFSLADNVPINTDDGWDDGTRVILPDDRILSCITANGEETAGPDDWVIRRGVRVEVMPDDQFRAAFVVPR